MFGSMNSTAAALAVALIAGLATPAIAPAAFAAGFALKEQSATAQGNAFAGATAGADDISYMFFNPAGLTRHGGKQAAASLSVIIPKATFDLESAATVLGTPISGDDGGGDIGKDAVVPSLYLTWATPYDLHLGLGVNAPFGLKTHYEDDWAGRYHALDSRATSVNINPAAAYKVSDGLSIGVGAQIQYIDVKLSNAVDFGTIAALGAASSPALAGALAAAGITPSPGNVQQDGRVVLRGHDVGFGFNLGMLYEFSKATRFGIAYRSRIEHTLEDDDVDFDLGNVGSVLNAATGQFADGGVKADFEAPESFSFGLHHDINDQWSVMAEAAWTRWSAFDALIIEFDNPADDPSFTDESWKDSWFLSLGATYRPTEALTLRGGIAFDEGTVKDAERRTPRIPEADRYWISIGAGYQLKDWLSLNAAYTHLFLPEVSTNLRASDQGNLARGDLSGSYDSNVDIVSVSAVVRF